MKNGKTKEKKKPSVIGIFAVLTVIISCLLIVFRSEQGPIFGLLIIAACFVFPVMGLVIIELIWLLIKKLFENGRNRAKRRKIRRYRKKNIIEYRREVPGYGSHFFEKDAKTGKVTAHIFCDFDTPHDWESTEINVDAEEPYLDSAIEAVGYINANRDALVERIGSAVVESIIKSGLEMTDDIPEDAPEKRFEIVLIDIYPDKGGIWAEFQGIYHGVQTENGCCEYSAWLEMSTNELTAAVN